MEDVFKEKKHVIYNRKSQDFHWKVLHRTVFTESKLKLMKKSNGICKLCNVENETICHLIYECSMINYVWEKITNFIQELVESNIVISKKM